MQSWFARLGLLVAVGLVAACSNDGGESGSGTTMGPGIDDGSAVDPTSTTFEQGPFCDSIRALEQLDSQPEASSTAAVLAENDAMLDLIDEATVNVPADAPLEVEALFDDFHAIGAAIVAAGGDVDAAYRSIAENDPELMSRLSDSTSHADAFLFFADRCGTPLP